MKNKKPGFLNRALACALALSMAAGTTVPPGAASVRSRPEDGLSVRTLKIPGDLGSLEEVFVPEGKASSPAVIFVQDAHGIPQAQKSIRRLVEFLRDEHGVRFTGVEGTSGKLDGLLFQTFPARRILEEVFEEFSARGEIPGAILACAFDVSSGMRYEGLEDLPLYEKNITAYLQAREIRPLFENRLEELSKDTATLKSRLYSPEHLELDALAKDLSNGENFSHALSRFRDFLKSRQIEIDPAVYPRVAALMERQAGGPGSGILRKEVDDAAARILRALETAEDRQEFQRRQQDYRTERISPEEFLDYLEKAKERVRAGVRFSSGLQEALEQHRRIHSMTGKEFFSELALLLERARTAVPMSAEASRLQFLDRRLSQFRKMLDFELARNEWAELLDSFENGTLSLPAGSGDPEDNLTRLETGLSALSGQLRRSPFPVFYEAAENRERAMASRLLKAMKEMKAASAIAVAGGFHREGLTALLRKEGVAYAVVSPQIDSLEGEEAYARHMRGDVSWKNYFAARGGRINVYDAFSRAAVRKLTAAYENETGFDGAFFPWAEWRSAILKRLAGEKRLHEAGRYTGFLDEILLGMQGVRRESIETAWKEKVEAFTQAAGRLASQGRLDAQAVSDLLRTHTAAAWGPSAIFSPGVDVPEQWVHSELREAAPAEEALDLRRRIFSEDGLDAGVKEAILLLVPQPVWEFLAAQGIAPQDIGWQTASAAIPPAKGNYVMRVLRYPHVPDGTVLAVLAPLIRGREAFLHDDALVYVPLQDIGDNSLAVLRNGKLERGVFPDPLYSKDPFSYWTTRHLDEFSRRLGFTEQYLEAVRIPAGSLETLGYERIGPFMKRRVPQGQALRAELRGESPAESAMLPGLRMAFNLKDVGAVVRDGKLLYEDSWRKAKELLPIWKSQHIGHVYPYGGLYEMGEVGFHAHRGRYGYPEKHPPEPIVAAGGRVVAAVQDYPTKKTEYELTGEAGEEGGQARLEVQDGHNPFSIYSMLLLNSQLSAALGSPGSHEKTLAQMKEFIDEAHRLGMKVTLDFFPWLAPDAIDESNYRLTFFREISDAQNEDFRSRDEAGKIEFMKDLVKENHGSFAVRLTEGGRERVILVKNLKSDMGGFNIDQAVLNPFLPEVQDYLVKALEQLIDAGADEVRADLAHVMLRDYITGPGQGYFTPEYAESFERNTGVSVQSFLENAEEPWKTIIDRASAYGETKGRRLEFKLESYDEQHRAALAKLGAQRQYYPDFFKNLMAVSRGDPANYLAGAVRHILGNRGRLLSYPSNYDQFPMKNIGGAQEAMTALALVLTYLGADVMWDFRDWLGMSGHVFPMVGGNLDPRDPHHHAFAGQSDFEILTDPDRLKEAAARAPAGGVLNEMLEKTGSFRETWIEVTENSAPERFITLAWRNEKDEWVFFAADFRPEREGGLEWVDVPKRAMVDLVRDRTKGLPEAYDSAGGRIDVNWDEVRLENVAMDPGRQFAIFRMKRSELREAPVLAAVENFFRPAGEFLRTIHPLLVAGSAGPAAVYAGRPRSELREISSMDNAVFWGEGKAAETLTARVRRQPAGPVLDGVLEKILEAAAGMQPGEDRDLALKVAKHLDELISGEKQEQILLFNEQRWTDGSYLLGRISRETVLFGAGFLDDPELAAQALFAAAAKHLGLVQPETFAEAPERDALRRKVFGRDEDTGIFQTYRAFRELSAPVFLDSAMKRFTEFDEGSPYFESTSLMLDWVRYDRDSQSHSTVEQAGFLASKIWPDFVRFLRAKKRIAILGGLSGPLVPSSIEAVNQKEKRELEEAVRDFEKSKKPAYFKILYPLFTFSLYRRDYFVALKKTREDLVKQIGEAYEIKAPGQKVDERDIERVMESYLKRGAQIHEIDDSVLLVTALPGEISADAFESVRSANSSLVHEGLQGGRRWMERSVQKYITDDFFPVEGLGDVTKEEMKDFFREFSGQRAGLELVAHLNGVSGDYVYPALGTAYEEWKSDDGSLTMFYIDGIHVGLPQSPRRMLYYSHDPAGDHLSVQLYYQSIWADLLDWFYSNYSNPLTTHKGDLGRALSALVRIRHRLTYKHGTGGYFTPEGADMKSWVRRIAELQESVDREFWKKVKQHYGSYASFLDLLKTEEGRGEARLFWYYTLLTGRDGIMARLGRQLQVQPQTGRFTPDGSLAFIDALTTLLWSGPPRLDRGSEIRFLFFRLLSYVSLYHDGVAPKDLEGLRDFLRLYLPPEDGEAEPFDAWRTRFLTDFPIADEDERTGVLELIAREFDADGDTAYVDFENPFMAPLPFPAADLLYPEKHPAGDLLQEVFWIGRYSENGLTVPGTNFRFVIEGVAPGTLLQVNVENGRLKISPYRSELRDEEAEDILVDLPLEDVKSPFGMKGLTAAGAAWEKRLLLDAFEIHEPGPGETVSSDGFYRLPLGREGLVRLRRASGVLALRLAGDHPRPSVILQKAGNRYFFYRDGDGAVIAEAVLNSAVSPVVSLSGAEQLPGLLAPVAHLEPASSGDYWKFNAIAGHLKDLMDSGRGYGRIDIGDGDEVRLERTGRVWSVVVPAKLVSSLERLHDQLEHRLQEEDPVIGLRAALESLRQIWNSEDIFNPDVELPAAPLPVDPEDRQAWQKGQAGSFGSDEYEARYEEFKRLYRDAVVLRKVEAFRRDRSGPDRLSDSMSGDKTRRLAREALNFHRKNPEQDFYFHTGSTQYHAVTGLLGDEKHGAREGVGIGIDSYFKYVENKKIIEKKQTHIELVASSEPSGRKHLFIRHNRQVSLEGGRQVKIPEAVLFDLETGEIIREKDYLFEEKAQRVDEARRSVLEDALRHETQLDLEVFADRLDDFLGRFEGEDPIQVMEWKMDVLKELEDTLPRALDSATYSNELNYAVLDAIFADILAQGPEKAAARAKALSTTFKDMTKIRKHKLIDDMQSVLYFYADVFGIEQEHLTQPPEDPRIRQHFAENLQEFVDMVLVPEITTYDYDRWTKEDFFERLVNKAAGVRELIEHLLAEHPDAVSEDGTMWTDAVLARQFELLQSGTRETTPMQRFFIRAALMRQLEARLAAQREEEERLEREQMSRSEIERRTVHMETYGGSSGIGASSLGLWYQGNAEKPSSILVDAGVALTSPYGLPAFPDYSEIPPEDHPKAIFLTHTHTDHVGGLVPLLKKLRAGTPVFIPKGGKVLLRQRLAAMARDMQTKYEERSRAAGRELTRSRWVLFEQSEVETFLEQVHELEINTWYEAAGNMKVRYHGPVGHLHAAASLVVSTPDGNVFISGDISKRAQGPVPGFREWPQDIPIHYAVMESTHGMLDRESEAEQERRLVRKIAEVFSRGRGRILIPSADGRAQRVLHVILKHLDEIPQPMRDRLRIYMEGQISDTTAIYQEAYPEIQDPRVVLVRQAADRAALKREVLRRPDPTIIIAGSGNASFGMARLYAENMIENEEDLFIFVGFQDEEEAGGRLLKAQRGSHFQFDPSPHARYFRVSAEIADFRLAGHASGHEILDILESMNVDGSLRRVLFVHGSTERRQQLIRAFHQRSGKYIANQTRENVRQAYPVLETADLRGEQQTRFESYAAVKLPAAVEEPAPEPAATETEALPVPGIPEITETAAAPEETPPAEEEIAGVFEETPLLLPEMEIFRGKLTRPSRLALLKLKLNEEAGLTAGQAREWLMQAVEEQGKERSVAEFSVSTLEKDLREIRKDRSELREAVVPVLTALASGRPELLEAADRSLAAWPQAIAVHGAPALFETVREEAGNPRYAAMFGVETGSDAETLAFLEDMASLRRRHAGLDADYPAFVSRLAEAAVSGLEAARQDPNEKPFFTFAYRLPADEKVRDHLLRYLEKIRASGLKGDVRILVTGEERADERLKEFFERLGRTGFAKPVIFDRPSGHSELQLFLEKSPKALVYGWKSPAIPGLESRFVRSTLDSEGLFPVVILFSKWIGEDARAAISAELLREVADIVEFARFNGTSLEIDTRLLMELIYKIEAQELIASMA